MYTDNLLRLVQTSSYSSIQIVTAVLFAIHPLRRHKKLDYYHFMIKNSTNGIVKKKCT